MLQKDNPEAYSLAHHVIQSSPSVGVCVTSTVHNDMMCTCICIQIFIYARVYTRFREYWQAWDGHTKNLPTQQTVYPVQTCGWRRKNSSQEAFDIAANNDDNDDDDDDDDDDGDDGDDDDDDDDDFSLRW